MEKNSNMEKPTEEQIRDIIKYGATVVSFILVFVTFLFKINYDTGFVFAKPLIFVLGATMFIMSGTITQIVSVIKSSKLLLNFSYSFYIISVILYMATVDLLLYGVQGVEDDMIFSFIRFLMMAIIVIPIGLLLYVFLTKFFKTKKNK